MSLVLRWTPGHAGKSNPRNVPRELPTAPVPADRREAALGLVAKVPRRRPRRVVVPPPAAARFDVGQSASRRTSWPMRSRGPLPGGHRSRPGCRVHPRLHTPATAVHGSQAVVAIENSADTAHGRKNAIRASCPSRQEPPRKPRLRNQARVERQLATHKLPLATDRVGEWRAGRPWSGVRDAERQLPHAALIAATSPRAYSGRNSWITVTSRICLLEGSKQRI